MIELALQFQKIGSRPMVHIPTSMEVDIHVLVPALPQKGDYIRFTDKETGKIKEFLVGKLIFTDNENSILVEGRILG